jgi:hypothetical protein
VGEDELWSMTNPELKVGDQISSLFGLFLEYKRVVDDFGELVA